MNKEFIRTFQNLRISKVNSFLEQRLISNKRGSVYYIFLPILVLHFYFFSIFFYKLYRVIQLSNLNAEQTRHRSTNIDSNLLIPMKYNQRGLILENYIETALAYFLNYNETLLEDVVSHGCFCSKLKVQDEETFTMILEEHVNLEEMSKLDKICKSWLKVRSCNDNFIGGSCYLTSGLNFLQKSGEYTLTINKIDIKKSSCQGSSHGCNYDTCVIDLHFLLLMKEEVEKGFNFGHDITDCSTFNTGQSTDLGLKCQGQPPNLELVIP